MSRALNATALAALTQREIQVFFAVKLEFDTPLRLWSGIGQMLINGEEYTGGGAMLGISKIDEVLEISARGAQLTLSGIPRGQTEPLKLALTTKYQGKKGTISLCVLGADSPVDLTAAGQDNAGLFDNVFTGFMDMMNIDESEESSTISLSLESRLVALRRPSNIRFTPNWLKSKYPQDKGLDFTNTTPLKKIRWGR